MKILTRENCWSMCGNNVHFRKITDCISVLRITAILISDTYNIL